jgi:hypothetical protein
MDRKTFLIAGAGTAFGGCARARTTDRYEQIEGAGEPLRSAFNRDVGKVRIVMLVSPT